MQTVEFIAEAHHGSRHEVSGAQRSRARTINLLGEIEQLIGPFAVAAGPIGEHLAVEVNEILGV